MNRRRASDIFGMLTNPEVPLLFLVGTVVLAVLGNGFYDLLLAWLGAGLAAIFWLTAGALGLLAAIVLALWAYFNARRPPRVAPVPAARRLEEGRAGLVVLVSEREGGSEKAAIRHHLAAGALRRLWLIISPEARGRVPELIEWFRAEGGARVELIQLPLGDAFETASAYAAVLDALGLAGDILDQVIVDITGGTKFMSAGAVLACREYGVPMQYVRVPYIGGRPVLDATPQVMKVDL